MRLPWRRPRRVPGTAVDNGSAHDGPSRPGHDRVADVVRDGAADDRAGAPGTALRRHPAPVGHDDRVALLLDDVRRARAELDVAVADLRRLASGPAVGPAESRALARGRALDTAIVTAVFDAARPPAAEIARCAGVEEDYLDAIRARLGA